MDRISRDDVLELTIEDLGFEGKGIARYGGELVVFVDGAVPGDVVSARVKKVKKKFAEAVTEEILTKSEFRAEPSCQHFGTCNGCKMQNTQYEKQLEIKRQHVLNSFERIGGFKDVVVPPVIGSKNIFFYRNKLEFSFSANRWLTDADKNSENGTGRFALGFHMPGFIDKVVDITDCRLQSEFSNMVLNLTRDFFKRKGISIYTTKTHEGFLRYLIIRQSANANEVMINLVTSEENDKLISEYAQLVLKESLNKDFGLQAPTIINSISSTKSQAVKADSYIVFAGHGHIYETLGKYRFKITPSTFFQTNTKQCEVLFDTLLKLGNFKKADRVLDLYCGCGAISLYLSEYVNKVFGVELSAESIGAAHENAELNNVKNSDFAAYDVKDYLVVISEESEHKFDTIILDPPRSGIHPKAAEYLNQYGAKKLIYVSCNPATQARDIKLLEEKYDIAEMQPVDMFPHTFHIENIVRLELR